MRNVTPEEAKLKSCFGIKSYRYFLPRPRFIVYNRARNHLNENLQFIKETLPLINADRFTVTLFTDFINFRKLSNGGLIIFQNDEMKGFISLYCAEYLLCNTMSITEYHHIAHDEITGSLWGVPWDKALQCTICHEISHAYQFWMSHHMTSLFQTAEWFPELNPYLKGANGFQIAEMWKGHNIVWQHIYRKIRGHFMGLRHQLS